MVLRAEMTLRSASAMVSMALGIGLGTLVLNARGV